MTFDEFRTMLGLELERAVSSGYGLEVFDERAYVYRKGTGLRVMIPFAKTYDKAASYKETDYLADAESIKLLTKEIMNVVSESLETEYLKKLNEDLVDGTGDIDFDNLKKHLYAELNAVSSFENGRTVKERAIEYLGNDLAITLRLRYGETDIGEPLTKEALQNICAKYDSYEEDDPAVTLYKAAMENSTKDYFLAQIPKGIVNLPEGTLENDVLLLGSTSHYAAAAIAREDVRKEIKETVGEKYILIPASKHNLFIYPYENEVDKETYLILEQSLKDLYRDPVHAENTDNNSFLSTNLYRYEASRNRYITITDGIEEDLSKSKNAINILRCDCKLDLISNLGQRYNKVMLPAGTKVGDVDLSGGYLNPISKAISVSPYNESYMRLEFNKGQVFKVFFDTDRASEVVQGSLLAEAVDEANKSLAKRLERNKMAALRSQSKAIAARQREAYLGEELD